MNISNFGRLIGAGLLALGLHALTPGVAAGDADRLDTGAVSAGDRAAPSSRGFDRALVDAQATLSPAGGRRSIESPE
jgi:hypothetical protein